jgi:hypothetical protein
VQQSNVHGAEIVRRGRFPVENRVATGTLGRERLSLDDDVGVPADRAGKRPLVGGAGGNDSWEASGTVEHRVDQRPLLRFCVVLVLGKTEVERQDAPRIETEVKTKKRREAANEEACRRKEHHYRRELPCHEQLSHPRGRRRRSRRPRSLVKSGQGPGAAVAPCREQPDRDRSRQA